MTNEQLVQYLRVCADLADKPGDGIAHVGVGHLRQAIALLSPSDEPKAEPDLALDRTGPFCNEHLTDVRAWCVECLLTTNERRALKPGAYR